MTARFFHCCNCGHVRVSSNLALLTRARGGRRRPARRHSHHQSISSTMRGSEHCTQSAALLRALARSGLCGHSLVLVPALRQLLLRSRDGLAMRWLLELRLGLSRCRWFGTLRRRLPQNVGRRLEGNDLCPDAGSHGPPAAVSAEAPVNQVQTHQEASWTQPKCMPFPAKRWSAVPNKGSETRSGRCHAAEVCHEL